MNPDIIEKKKNQYSHHSLENIPQDFNPIVAKPFNIDKVTLDQIDNLNINYIFTTGRSASTLLGVMLMMHDQVVFSSEEVFPIILKQKYGKIKQWTEKEITQYCDDFVLLSEGKLYPLFCGKDVLFELLSKFQKHLNYERVIKLSYLSFGGGKDLSKIKNVVDKQLRYYLAEYYLKLFPTAKIILLVRDPRDNTFSKHNRAKRRGITPQDDVYTYTWLNAYHQYLYLLRKYHLKYILVQYEQFIENSEMTMQQISDFLHIRYTQKYFDYPQITRSFFESINYPELKKHFTITHSSLLQPISPTKINEWKNQMHIPEIKNMIDHAWDITKHIAQQFSFQEHENFTPPKTTWASIKIKFRLQLNYLISFIYFQLVPFFVKRWIKHYKYPYRNNALSTFDRFLTQKHL